MAAASNHGKNRPLACPSIASSSAGQCFPETLGDRATPHSTHLREPSVPCGYNQEHPVPNITCSVYSLFQGEKGLQSKHPGIQ